MIAEWRGKARSNRRDNRFCLKSRRSRSSRNRLGVRSYASDIILVVCEIFFVAPNKSRGDRLETPGPFDDIGRLVKLHTVDV